MLALKFSLTEIAQKIKNLAQIEGRLQRVENSLGLKIYIDFAHSEDALKNVLKSLRQTKPLKIYTVFGCGGDRDRFKRPKMAQVAEKYADFSIVTSDNPRSENPLDICLEVASGFKNAEKYLVEVDRQKAIKIALQKAGAEDVVLIAGRGHEDFQQFDNHKLAFKDADMVVEMANILAESSS